MWGSAKYKARYSTACPYNFLHDGDSCYRHMGGGEIRLSDPAQAALCDRMDWHGRGYLAVSKDLTEHFLQAALAFG